MFCACPMSYLGTVPSEPSDVTVGAGPQIGEILVEWTASSDDGGYDVDSHTLYLSVVGGIVNEPEVTIDVDGIGVATVGGLRVGESYQVMVSATNAIGEGRRSVPSPAILVGKKTGWVSGRLFITSTFLARFLSKTLTHKSGPLWWFNRAPVVCTNVPESRSKMSPVPLRCAGKWNRYHLFLPFKALRALANGFHRWEDGRWAFCVCGFYFVWFLPKWSRPGWKV